MIPYLDLHGRCDGDIHVHSVVGYKPSLQAFAMLEFLFLHTVGHTVDLYL